MSVVCCNLTKSYRACADSVPEVRRVLSELATAAGATPEEVEAIRLAASEAATNVVVHAYRDRPGEIHVTAAAVLDEFWILIGDDGCGMCVRSDGPGLGLDLVAVDGRRSGAQARGSEAAASCPASSRFSTTT